MTTSKKERALELVAQYQPITSAQVAKQLGIATDTATVYLREHESAGRVQRTITGRNNIWEMATQPYGQLPGDLPRHLRAPSIFAAGERAARAALPA